MRGTSPAHALYYLLYMHPLVTDNALDLLVLDVCFISAV